MSLKLDELYYDLQMDVQGLKDGVESAKKMLDKVAEYVKSPVAAAGIAAAALVAIGVKATTMAAEVDTAVRRLGASVPDAAAHMSQLKDAAAELSTQYGHSQVEIVKGMEAIARKGIANSEELIQASRAAVLAAEASGESLESITGSLDHVMDTFGLSAKDAEAILAKLFVTAQGKGTIEELTQGFGRLSEKLRASGVTFDIASEATATLIGRGNGARAAVKELGDTLEKEGAAGLEKLAAQSKITSNGLAELHAQAELNGLSAEALGRKLSANVAAVMIDLGNNILPTFLKVMQGVVAIFDLFNGSITKINADAAVATVNNLSAALGKVSAETVAKEFNRLEIAIMQAAGGNTTFGLTVSEMARNVESLGKLAPANLAAVDKGLQALVASGKLSDLEFRNAQQALVNLHAEMAKPGRSLPPIVAPGTVAATDAATDALVKLSAEQRRAVIASTTLDEGQKKVILSAKGLSDTMQNQVRGAMKEAGEAAVKAGQAYKDAMDKITKTLIDSTVTMVDDTEYAIQKMTDELKKSGVAAADVARALRPLNDQLRLIQINEKLDLPDILKKSAEAFTQKDVANLQAGERELQAMYLMSVAGTKEHKAVAEQLLAVQTALKENAQEQARIALGKQIQTDFAGAVAEAGKLNIELPKIPGPIKTAKEHAIEVAKSIANVATGAIGVAQAFGLINSEAAATLGHIVNIGANLGKALGGNPTAIISVVGSLAGAVSSLFGDSPETKARKELVKKNTEALYALTEATGDLLRVQVTGGKLQAVQDTLSKLFGSGVGYGKAFDKLYGSLKVQSGLTDADFEKIGEQLGITIRNPKDGKIEFDAMRQLLAGLKDLDVGFEKSWKGARDALNAEIAAGLVTEDQKFAKLSDVLASSVGSGVLASAARAGDVNTAEGRAAITAALQAALQQFEGGTLSKGALGGLTGQQFLDTIEELIDLVKKAGESADGIAAPKPAAKPTVVADPQATASAADAVGTAVADSLPAPAEASAPVVDHLAIMADLSKQSVDAEVAIQALLTMVARNTESLLHAPWVETVGASASGGVPMSFALVIEQIALTPPPGADGAAMLAQLVGVLRTAEGRRVVGDYMTDILAEKIRADQALSGSITRS